MHHQYSYISNLYINYLYQLFRMHNCGGQNKYYYLGSSRKAAMHIFFILTITGKTGN